MMFSGTYFLSYVYFVIVYNNVRGIQMLLMDIGKNGTRKFEKQTLIDEL